MVGGYRQNVHYRLGHEIWYSPKTGKRFTVGRHNTEEVKTGTLTNPLKDAGVQQ